MSETKPPQTDEIPTFERYTTLLKRDLSCGLKKDDLIYCESCTEFQGKGLYMIAGEGKTWFAPIRSKKAAAKLNIKARVIGIYAPKDDFQKCRDCAAKDALIAELRNESEGDEEYA